MKHFNLFLFLLFSTVSYTQVEEIELRSDAIVVPRVKSDNVVSPIPGMLIYDIGSESFQYYDGAWKEVDGNFFDAISGGIRYTGGNVTVGGISPNPAKLAIGTTGSEDALRVRIGSATKFRIFNNGSISLGSNWNTPEPGALLISNTRTIINDTLFMSGRKLQITENGTLSIFKGAEEQIRLDANVNGDGRISTDELEIIGGSDFAEYFDVVDSAPEHILPGMVVSITGEQAQLAITSKKRDKKVVGIISGANGIETGMFMGQKGSIAHGDYPIAITGRTYVYANTENGKIEAGDFLTSSSQKGYAMKVRKMKKSQGAIIGKALTSLEKGEGFVLVLVNLQ